MARKKRPRTRAPALPLHQDEVWEVGRRPLQVAVTELEQRGERPEIVLVVQTGASRNVLGAMTVTSATPATALADCVLQAMRQPMQGSPRRPGVIRVSSQAEAEILTAPLATTDVAIDIAAQLADLEVFHAELEQHLGGMSCDYRTQAAQAGETLSEAGLRAFFRTASDFYRAEMWDLYSDEVVFEIAMPPTQGAPITLYGVLMGSMGEEFGLALFRSFEDFERFYNVSVEHLDEIISPPPKGRARRVDPAQMQREAEAMSQVVAVPSLALTFTPRREVPPPLLEEAQHLKLPVARAAAFPLVMRTGQGAISVATATDLATMHVAVRAILDWQKRVDDMESEDEVDVTVTSTLPAVPDFLPEVTVHTTLRVNPCLPEEDEEDEEDEIDETLAEELLTLLMPPSVSPGRKSAASGKQPSKGTPRQQPRQPGNNAAPKTTDDKRIYTLAVYLLGGPLSEAYAGQEISRQIDILGRQTLHDLHQAIFTAFERWEEHLYEFNLGAGPDDRSHLYASTGGLDDDEEDAGDPETTPLAALGLEMGQHFGYTFDMGDNWEHVIEVVAITEQRGSKGKYPRVVKQVGEAPPQYPDDDEDDDEDDD